MVARGYRHHRRDAEHRGARVDSHRAAARESFARAQWQTDAVVGRPRGGSRRFSRRNHFRRNHQSRTGKFGDDHEQELWTEFSAAMHGTETNRWLYEGDKAQGRPADMGYYEGYKICQAYYNKATDKQAAVRTILEMKDPEGFLKESGYDPR